MSNIYEHEIGESFYMNDGAGSHPVMTCSCGFAAHGYGGTWAEAGEEMDSHLEAKETEAHAEPT